MSSTNKTPNYALPQFIPTDKPTWLGDVNAAMLAIDTAMADNHTTSESANTAASAAVAQVQHAVDTATEAKVDSAAALQNATNAIGVAQNALNSATQATQTAQAATQTANAANNSAASAVATANQAKQTADATDAELTEFQHSFSNWITNLLEGSLSNLLVNPASVSIELNAQNIEANQETDFFKLHGDLIGSKDPRWVINVTSKLNIISKYDQESNTTTIAAASTEKIINVHYIITFAWTFGQYKNVVNNNPNTRAQNPRPLVVNVLKL